MRSVEIEVPAAYSACPGVLEVLHEEDALGWFWALPELFPWPRPVAWLYTPVCGNDRWPGDLWGIDAEGNLLVVECKQCRRHDDPFRDFVTYHRPGRTELSAEHWRTKFLRHLAAELRHDTAIAEREPGRTAGMLPRSNHRDHLRRWPQIARLIDEQIRCDHFRTTALGYLAERAVRGDPTPYYIGLMVICREGERVFTDEGLNSAMSLIQIVGQDFVRAVATKATRLANGRLRIEAMSVNLTDGSLTR